MHQSQYLTKRYPVPWSIDRSNTPARFGNVGVKIKDANNHVIMVISADDYDDIDDYDLYLATLVVKCVNNTLHSFDSDFTGA